MTRKRVLVAMSGGVDSSVAAAELVAAGHEVTGVTLKLWGGPQDSGCCSASDVEDARRVAAQLDIPHYVFNYADQFARDVVDPFVSAYEAGRTPNPCVECNRHLKFGALLQRADQLGFDHVATGHHARIDRSGPAPLLRRGVDRTKDQSYVLYMLGREVLERCEFPIGEMSKAEVRSRAGALGLRTANKAESQDVCFVRSGERVQFLAGRSQARPGTIVDVVGRTVGNHSGIGAFTIGQRRGLGVAAGARRYVVDIDAASATVTIGDGRDLLVHEIVTSGWAWVNSAPGDGATVDVQTRAHGRVFPGVLRGDAVAPLEPVERVAPGQVVALYDGDVLLGGALAR